MLSAGEVIKPRHEADRLVTSNKERVFPALLVIGDRAAAARDDRKLHVVDVKRVPEGLPICDGLLFDRVEVDGLAEGRHIAPRRSMAIDENYLFIVGIPCAWAVSLECPARRRSRDEIVRAPKLPPPPQSGANREFVSDEWPLLPLRSRASGRCPGDGRSRPPESSHPRRNRGAAMQCSGVRGRLPSVAQSIVQHAV